MVRRKTCHPEKVKMMKSGVSVSLKFDHQMYGYILKAAQMYTEGCVCDLVGSLFLDRFEQLSKEIFVNISKVESKN